MHVMVYTKISQFDNFQSLSDFMHHGGNLENNFHWNFVINDSFCPKLTLCCEINAHINEIIVQKKIVLICKAFKHLCNSNKSTKKYYI
jgi:hypothetical protein